MHYAPSEFSNKPRVPAMISVDGNLQHSMGNLEGPSFLDVYLLNRHYNCMKRCSSPPACLNGGFVDARNCSQCKSDLPPPPTADVPRASVEPSVRTSPSRRPSAVRVEIFLQ